ncbi:MAG: right-handed parallel beta-helix repeat-containing protein [Labilithrix sp.]|nr:right-handed parallel beta-helix repeat-containing protein [Labilithrix sp.]
MKRAAIVASVLLVACAGEPPPPAPSEASAPADEACPASSYRAALDEGCVTGAYATCFEGSRRRASGWGCEAIVSPVACTGATRDAIGEEGCVPVGDCDAPFPPSDATHFVSPAAIVDATHFQTIRDAVDAAPAGAVIAVDAGEYRESVVVQKPVTLAGRCPARVAWQGAPRDRALRVEGVKATVRGFTFESSVVGVSLGSGASLTLEDSVVDGNTLAGVIIADGNARADLARVVIRNTRPSNEGDRGVGINVQGKSVLVARDCAFAGNHTQNVRVSTESEATLERIVSRDGRPTPAADYGRGIQVQQGARATITRAAFLDNHDIGIVAGDDTRIDLREVIVARTKLAASGQFGRALNAHGRAIVQGEHVHLHDNHDATVMVAEAGTSVSLVASTVVDTDYDKEGLAGRAVTTQEGASFEMRDGAVVGSKEVAVVVFGRGSRATLRRTVIRQTAPNWGDYFGHGAMASFGGTLALEDVEVAESFGTGIAIGDGAALLSRVRVRDNQVGLYVQDGTALRELVSVSTDKGEEENAVLVSIDSVFLGNATRLSAGVLPLPEPSRSIGP